MSGWVMALVIGVLFIMVVVLAVLLFFLWQEQPQKQEPAVEQLALPAIEAPIEAPRIVLRKPQVANENFRRRQILGTAPGALPQTPTTPPVTLHRFTKLAQKPNGNGRPKIKPREVKIELDAICKITGMPVRECPCRPCQEMRAHVGN